MFLSVLNKIETSEIFRKESLSDPTIMFFIVVILLSIIVIVYLSLKNTGLKTKLIISSIMIGCYGLYELFCLVFNLFNQLLSSNARSNMTTVRLIFLYFILVTSIPAAAEFFKDYLPNKLKIEKN